MPPGTIITIILEQNFYHVLEENTSKTCDKTFPVYQELNNVSTVEADRAEINNGSLTFPCVETIQDYQNAQPPPVYQDIDALPEIQESSA